jgi:hypothetical protein
LAAIPPTPIGHHDVRDGRDPSDGIRGLRLPEPGVDDALARRDRDTNTDEVRPLGAPHDIQREQRPLVRAL